MPTSYEDNSPIMGFQESNVLGFSIPDTVTSVVILNKDHCRMRNY